MRTSAGLAVFAWVLATVAASGCFDLFQPPKATFIRDYLTDSKYPKLVVEIDYQGDNIPRDVALQILERRIEERCYKSVTIEKQSFSDSRTKWSLDDIKDAEKKHRNQFSSGDTAVLYILYLAGEYEKNDVLGVTYSHTAFTVFQDRVEASPLFPIPSFQAADVEKSVLVHEFGHIVGLVNIGTPMVRDHEDPDPEHKGHSKNRNSVMYWAVESFAIRDNFNTAPPTQFDEDDIADLRAAGGR